MPLYLGSLAGFLHKNIGVPKRPALAFNELSQQDHFNALRAELKWSAFCGLLFTLSDKLAVQKL